MAKYKQNKKGNSYLPIIYLLATFGTLTASTIMNNTKYQDKSYSRTIQTQAAESNLVERVLGDK